MARTALCAAVMPTSRPVSGFADIPPAPPASIDDPPEPKAPPAPATPPAPKAPPLPAAPPTPPNPPTLPAAPPMAAAPTPAVTPSPATPPDAGAGGTTTTPPPALAMIPDCPPDGFTGAPLPICMAGGAPGTPPAEPPEPSASTPPPPPSAALHPASTTMHAAHIERAQHERDEVPSIGPAACSTSLPRASPERQRDCVGCLATLTPRNGRSAARAGPDLTARSSVQPRTTEAKSPSASRRRQADRYCATWITPSVAGWSTPFARISRSVSHAPAAGAEGVLGIAATAKRGMTADAMRAAFIGAPFLRRGGDAGTVMGALRRI